MIDLWISKAIADRILLTREVLQQKWNIFADLARVPKDNRLKLSNGWLAWFKDRNGLREWKQHGEAASANNKMVEQEQTRIQNLIKDGQYQLRDIYNMDETGLFY